MPQPMWKKALARDEAGLAGFGGTLLAASSNFEDGLTNGGALRIYVTAQSVSGESVMGQNVTAGPVAMADLDLDGDLDLFIGGRSVPGRYPEPADSILMRNQNGKFSLAHRFAKLGMVTSALFSDLNDDGKPDLVVALEWGEIKVFLNEKGGLKEKAFPGLASKTGWWNAIATGDFDNDGRMDIVAANWGSNTKYAMTTGHRIYFGDFDDNGSSDVLEAGVRSDGILAPERGFKTLGEAMPFLKEKFPTYAAFSKASVQEVLGKSFESAKMLEANTLTSMVFLNRGDHFEASELPVEAQLAPAMGVTVADFDGDGAQDIFLAQNFYAHNGDTFRNDAGRGLLLRGDGHGKFAPMSGTESGLLIYGDQRGCAAADYDGDGRIDLAVGQNGAQTKLFRNQTAKPGLRVRLTGPGANPACIGAKVRIDGAAQEVQAGTGRYSQNGQTLIFAAPAEGSELTIRWPNGKTTTRKIEPTEKQIVVEIPK